jgi:beta-lactam-binding protein with PASTA domain
MAKRLILALVVALSLGGGFLGGWFARQPEARVVVPDVQGLAGAPATDLLQRAGLRVSFIQSPPTTLPNEPIVADQNPQPGTSVDPGTTVQLQMSPGPPK